MAGLEQFIGLSVRDGVDSSSFTKSLLKDGGGAVYHTVVMPMDWDEADGFHEYGANEYDFLVKVDATGRVEDFALRIDQCPHGGRNFAPSGAPAWIFPAGARFTLDWEDVAPLAQERMLGMLAKLTGLTVQ
jgi:hypothetical protein